MSDLWRQQGFRITIQRGPGPRVDADLAFLHVDTTLVPPDYLACIRLYDGAVNGRVSDISKRRISLQQVQRGDGYGGPVIVKTNGNYFGVPDTAHDRQRGPFHELGYLLRRLLPWYCRARLFSYPIFPSSAQVPFPVWYNRDLMVERFLTERQGEDYCLRTWVFLGDRETNSISFSKVPVVKFDTIYRREAVEEVPAELRAIRKKLGFDFGKFDYGIVDGAVVLYDTNTTPMWPGDDEGFTARAHWLSGGLASLLS